MAQLDTTTGAASWITLPGREDAAASGSIPLPPVPDPRTTWLLSRVQKNSARRRARAPACASPSRTPDTTNVAGGRHHRQQPSPHAQRLTHIAHSTPSIEQSPSQEPRGCISAPPAVPTLPASSAAMVPPQPASGATTAGGIGASRSAVLPNAALANGPGDAGGTGGTNGGCGMSVRLTLDAFSIACSQILLAAMNPYEIFGYSKPGTVQRRVVRIQRVIKDPAALTTRGFASS